MNDNLQDTCACDPCVCASSSTCANSANTKSCTANVFEYADVSVPLKIKPCAIVGKIETECCGEPVITARQCRNGNGSCSCSCELTITQTVCIKIPITYGVDTDIGETVAICKRSSTTGACCR